jgi:cation:H+ antiporter
MVLDIIILIIGLVILLYGGELLVRGASNLAYSFQISPLVIGLTVVAFGTSAPELIISLNAAAIHGATNLSISNVVGSNICNLSLVMGITAMFYPIFVDDNSIKIDWLMTMGSSLLLFFFISRDQTVDRFEGVIFILILVIYTYFLIEMSRRQTREKLAAEQEINPDQIPTTGPSMAREVTIFVFGCIGLYIGSELFVGSVVGIDKLFNFIDVKGFGIEVVGLAERLDLPEHIVGLTIVAIGTSLPELAASCIAAYKKNTDLALGNLLGSCIFNNLSILGFTSLIKEIDNIDQKLIDNQMLWMLGIVLLILPMMISRRKIGVVEGSILLVVYGIFLYTLL